VLDNDIALLYIGKVIMESLAQTAVSLAMNGDWTKAVKTNLQILKQNREDLGALNRLARAYFELGEISKARTTAQKVLKVDPINPIASKCLEKWKGLKAGDKQNHKGLGSESFLEEPGRTKLVNLIHLGGSDVLAKLAAGDAIGLLSHPHRVSAITSDEKYVGRLPDDLAARLGKLIKMGVKYQVLVKSIEKGSVKVFIREIEKPVSAKSMISFPGEKIEYVSFTPPELVHKKEILTEEV
jgi:tetratricopeptide (TPR) repeat protein